VGTNSGAMNVDYVTPRKTVNEVSRLTRIENRQNII
jgi:hypothetical protein